MAVVVNDGVVTIDSTVEGELDSLVLMLREAKASFSYTQYVWTADDHKYSVSIYPYVGDADDAS